MAATNKLSKRHCTVVHSFYLNECRVLFKLKFPCFPLHSLKRDSISSPFPDPASWHQAQVLPSLSHGPPQKRVHTRKPSVSHLGLSGRHRNPHVATGLAREELLWVKSCDMDVNFLKTGCYRKPAIPDHLTTKIIKTLPTKSAQA